MAQILAVGVATLDVINEVACYPAEDSEVRALSHAIRRGGNATNTLVVLSQLGHACEWAGVWVDEADSWIVRSDLERYAIGAQYCRRVSTGKLPTSYITCSLANGSRTIVHYRDLPEFDFPAFRAIPLERFDWLHFEARNISETARMMEHVRHAYATLPISLEVEKPREGVEALFSYPRLLLFSSAYADHCGESPESLLHTVKSRAPAADLVCTQSDAGAVGLSRQGKLLFSRAHPPERVIDTIGAGDTFNAGMIDAFVRNGSLERAMNRASRLAGRKCGRRGLHGLLGTS